MTAVARVKPRWVPLASLPRFRGRSKALGLVRAIILGPEVGAFLGRSSESGAAFFRCDRDEANFDRLPVGGYAGFRIGIGALPAFRHVTNVTRFLIAEILL